MKTKITIRKNKSLERLAQRCKISIHSVDEFLISKLSDKGIIYLNETEFCGMTLLEMFKHQGITLTGFAVKAFGNTFYFPELLKILENIQIWGIEDECTECGCEMEYSGTFNSNYSKCINCGNERFEHDYNPDQYRDDCICTGIEINEIKTYHLN